tara:strand:- start:2478 stop:2819 length:342 start_codon:yes stop_codon:yes gene_type:complete
MKNRPESYMLEGRISRDRLISEEYEHKTQAEIETLRNYFSEEWFDKKYTRYVNTRRSRLQTRSSKYPLQKCPICKKTWNIYIKQGNNRKTKEVQYWNDFERLPKPKKICPNCL